MLITDTEAARQITEAVEDADMDTLSAIYAATFGCTCQLEVTEDHDWMLRVEAEAEPEFWLEMYRRYIHGVNMDYGVKPGDTWQRAVWRCRNMGDSLASALIENTVDSESLEDAERQVQSMIDDLASCLS